MQVLIVPEPIHSILVLTVSMVLTFSAGLIGAQYRPGQWYADLSKPAWTPPDRIFGPVWMVLYIMMALAAWLVWQRRGIPGAAPAFSLFLIQLALNAAWSWLFFGLKRPELALGGILLLWGVILATLISFWQIDIAAGLLLIPYLAWVSFAAVLNLFIWKMNR